MPAWMRHADLALGLAMASALDNQTLAKHGELLLNAVNPGKRVRCAMGMQQEIAEVWLCMPWPCGGFASGMAARSRSQKVRPTVWSPH